ncbi:MAG: hypothetical protein SGBAC_010341 [Bacillariaceae sp.]
MTTVETRVVNPVSRGGVDNVHATEAELDAAITHEEETILVDEEISSSEGEMENHMLTVALVNSVVKSAPVDPSARYGLRKRRRPGDVVTGEHVEDPTRPFRSPSGERGHAPSALPISKADATQHVNKSQRTLPPVKQEPGAILSVHNPIAGAKAKQRQELLIIKQSNAKGGTQIKDHPILGKLSSNFTHLSGSGKSQGALLPPVKPATLVKQKPFVPRGKLKHPAAPLVRQNLVPTSGAVPNPLSHKPATPTPISVPRSYTPKTSNPVAKSKAVPCPLPQSVPCPLQPPLVPQASVAPAPVVPSAVPSSEKKRVTITEPTIPPARARIFSVDLDASTFDFSDMAGDHNVHDRSDSVDMPPPDSTDFPVLHRDRAFSFDLFNFTHDDLLSSGGPSSELAHPGAPPLMDDISPMPHPRPRGDSIIFDPVSFQEGGIHEKNALSKARDAAPSAPHRPALPSPCLSSDPSRPKLNLPSATTPMPAYSGVPRDPMANSGQIATLPSSLSNTSPSNVNASPATFQMELLNKDGRIGIYLPEARRARIARFHAKRKMRIWRKRIKYDCRKKLADSRPRIKGRFVKRSDMEGDE